MTTRNNSPMGLKVPFVAFPAQFEDERREIMACVGKVFKKGIFVGEVPVRKFEESVAAYCGVAHAVGVGSGTDALFLAMKVLGIGPGDEVITPPNSHFSSTSSIIQAGATPVFADVSEDLNIDPAAVEKAITDHTVAIMPVHLTGRIADMEAILDIVERHDLVVIEDAAQAIGATYKGKKAGGFGQVAAFSAHPLKSLGAAGDAGFITTDDPDLAQRIEMLRNNGLQGRDTVVEWGYVSRLDVLQAEILNMRLKKIDEIIAKRRENADLYRSLLKGGVVQCPVCQDYEFNAFHNFIIQVNDREGLKAFLLERGVQTAIHYPVPIHLQPAAKALGYQEGDFPKTERQSHRILSLPINQYIGREEIEFTAGIINEFFGETGA